MLTIGIFAQVGQVTVQALRHYDRLGLLKPGRVDKFTNYRYYSLTSCQGCIASLR